MNKQHLALSLSVGVIGGISVFLASTALSSIYLLWVGFIAVSYTHLTLPTKA